MGPATRVSSCALTMVACLTPPSKRAISPMMVPGSSVATTSPSGFTTLALPCTVNPGHTLHYIECQFSFKPSVPEAIEVISLHASKILEFS